MIQAVVFKIDDIFLKIGDNKNVFVVGIGIFKGLFLAVGGTAQRLRMCTGLNFIGKSQKLFFAYQPLVLAFKVVGQDLKLFVGTVSLSNLAGFGFCLFQQSHIAVAGVHTKRIIHKNAHRLFPFFDGSSIVAQKRLCKSQYQSSNSRQTTQKNEQMFQAAARSRFFFNFF